MEHKFSANMTDVDSMYFPNDIQPSADDNYAYCQVYKEDNELRPYALEFGPGLVHLIISY